MSFDILKVPFYKAVALFEAEKYAESFEIFAECALKGNLIAPFYLNYMLKQQDIEKTLNIQDKYAVFIKSLQEYIENIPKGWHPEAWCQASVAIIKYHNKLAKEKATIVKLEGLRHAANATIFLANYYHAKNKQDALIDILTFIVTNADLYFNYHLPKISFNANLDSVPGYKQLELENKVLEKSADAFIYTHGGHIQRLFSFYYAGNEVTGKDGDPTKVVSSSPFQKDLVRKFKWQMTGALQGNQQLHMLFASIKMHGKIEQTEAEVARWLYIAAENGEPQACVLYGINCGNEGKIAVAKSFLLKGLSTTFMSKVSPVLRGQGFCGLGSVFENEDDKEALKCYLEAEKLGNPLGMGNVGVFYECGRGGLEPDYQKAIMQYHKAIANGQDKIKQTLIESYHNKIAMIYVRGGFGIEKDLKIAAEHFKLAHPAQFGHLNTAQVLLVVGYFYEHGREDAGIAIDEKQAYEYYHQSAELGDALALNNKAFCLFNGIGCKEDIAAAEIYYKRSLEKGCKIAAYGLGCLYGWKQTVADDKLAYEHFKMAEALQDGDVYYELGLCYETGKGVPIDLDLAYHYYELAIKQGQTWAVKNYAILKLRSGMNGGSLDVDTLRDLKDKLEINVKKGFVTDIFIHGLVRLWLNPDEAKKILEELKIVQAKKPYKLNKNAIQYLSFQLERGKTITPLDVTLMFTYKNPLAKLKAIESEADTESDTKAASKPSSKPEGSRSIKNETNKMETDKKEKNKNETDKKEKNKQETNKNKTKWDRFQEKFNWFTDPKNRKCIRFEDFKKLLGEMSVLEEMQLEILPSKGSNTRIHLRSPESDKSLLYSYHPTHRSGSGMDSAFDPKRAKSMQKTLLYQQN